jgi:hypothetical protein
MYIDTFNSSIPLEISYNIGISRRYIHTYTCIYAFIYVLIYIYKHNTYAHIHMHIYICTHMPLKRTLRSRDYKQNYYYYIYTFNSSRDLLQHRDLSKICIYIYVYKCIYMYIFKYIQIIYTYTKYICTYVYM